MILSKLLCAAGAATATAIIAVAQVEPVSRCRRFPSIQAFGKTKVDVGSCKGFCRSPTADPWIPADFASTVDKEGVRICKPKATSTVRVPYTRIEKCDCVDKHSSTGQHELQTPEDYESQLKWERRGDSLFLDEEPVIKEKCRRVPRFELLGTDGAGQDVNVDVGECTGICPVVNQPRMLTINVTLTADDRIERLYIDGTDRTGALSNNAAWTTSDTILQTVPRATGTEHVIAVQAKDTSFKVQGLIATVAYDGAIQHVTGSGDWVAMSSAPAADTTGKQWYELNYDAASFTPPTDCTVADHNRWGTYWPAAFLNDGARFIWGPDNSCEVSQAETRESWFLLKFTIDPIPESECLPVASSTQVVEVEVVKSCDCQCKYKQECKAPLAWNDQKCQCECALDASSCPAGTIFNAETCSCENCGICSAATQGECLEKQCLYTFYPYSEYQGKPGNCVWRDFNGDGESECGCPQNQCQTREAAPKERCEKTVCKQRGDEPADMCTYNVHRVAGSECDCTDNQA